MDKRSERILLAVILIIGACLRFYNYWDFSLSNDELSALARLNFDSFSDLIQNGVRIDGHPAAAQVLLYYITGWFGTGVAVVRLPFVLAGTAAIYFVYRMGKEWVSDSAGLLSAATFAVLAFPLLYSRIARPYSLGMLFSVMAATYWIRILKNRFELKDLLYLAISLALCAYTHYFCALVAAMLAITGTFLVKGRTLRSYLIALTAAFILYLPHIPVFLHQLSLGGIGQWLGPPENDWPWQHIKYVFNDSAIVLFTVFGLSLVGWSIFRPSWNWRRMLLPLLFFLIPFLVGFAYSIYVNPVLQHSTLLFSFPFLLLFLFSGWEDSKPLLTRIAVAGILVVLLLNTVVRNRFFNTGHFGVFKEVAQDISSWNNEVSDDALLIGDFNHPSYIDYYLHWAGSIELDQYRVTDEKGLVELKRQLESSENEYLIYGWSTVNQLEVTQWLIREFYPQEIKRSIYFNSGSILYKRGGQAQAEAVFNFEMNDVWNFSTDTVQQDSTGGRSILLDSENPYGPSFTTSLSELETRGVTDVIVRLECRISDSRTAALMVFEQLNDGGSYVWRSDRFERQFDPDGPDWGVFHHRLKPSTGTDDVLKIYAWLPDGEPVGIRSMEVFFR